MNEVKYDVDALDSVDWQDVRFVDIFDISEIQHMQDLFADAHGVASLITDVEGNPITKPSNFSHFCENIIRKTELGCANCFKSDAALGSYNPNAANVQQCLSGGLWDAGASITVGGKHIANWLIGQVRNEDIDVEKLMQYANLIGADSDAYKAAFEKVPVMSTEKFTKVANLLFLIANELSEKAYSNILLRKQIGKNEIAHKALKESEERFQLLFNKAPLGYQSLDINACFIDVNQKWLDTLGYEREEVVGKWFGDFMPPKYQDIVKVNFPKFLAQGHIHVELEMLHKNGSTLFVAIDGKIGTDSDGNFKQTHCILQDITESKRTLDALKASEEKHRTILQTAMDGFWLVDLNGNLLEVNDAYCKMSGYTEDELLKMNIGDLDFVESEDITKEHIHKIKIYGQDRFETKHRRKDGSAIDVEITVKLFGADMLVVFLRDITTQNIAKQALTDAEWKFKALFELGPIGVAYHRMIYDENGAPFDYYFIDANASYNQLTGVSPKGMTVRQAFPGIENDPFDWIGNFGRVAKTGETFRFEQLLQSNGRWYDCVAYQYMPDHFVAAFTEITQRKEAEALLEKQKLSLSSIIEGTNVGTWEWNVQTGETIFNERWAEIEGYTLDEIMPVSIETWKKFAHPDDVIIATEKLNKHFAGELDYYEIETRMKHKNGEWVWILDRGKVHTWTADGKPLMMSGTHLDITERKKAEDALRESEERFRATFEQAAVGISQVGLDGRWLRVNQRLCDIVGYDRDTLLTLSFQDITHKDDLQNDLNNLQLLLAGETQNYSIEKRYIRKNGSTVWVNLTVGLVRDTLAKPKYFVSVIEDITHKKMAENALRESEEKLSKLFNTMTEIVVMHELVFDENQQPIDYRILDCNPAFSKYTGIEKENAVGMLATELYSTNIPPYLETYASVALNESSLDFTTYYQPLDKYFLISVVSTRKNRFSTITTDITASEKMHRFIEEKNKELENYIYVASHDLRSPLVNIQGFSQRLQKQSSQLAQAFELMNERSESANLAKTIVNTEMPKSLDFILNNVSKMDMLIGGLLQVSRTGRLALQPALVDMNALMATLLRAFDYQLNDFGANVELKMLDACFGDANQLNQLFSNIISNAIKYRDSSRSLKIAVASSVKYNKVVYSISDNGIGISEKQLPKIWDIFYRVNNNVEAPGEGLGLSIAKQIVDKHKGRIWAESVEGSGTTFFVELLRENFLE